MQPSPTSSLLSGNSRGLRAGITGFHATVFIALLALAACRDPKVATYRVPKESPTELPVSAPVHGAATADAAPAPTLPVLPPPPAAMGTMPGGATDPHALQTASGGGLAWTAPASWQSKQASSMRKATYVISGDGGATAELAVTAFPGDVGGDIANVNRWRGQVGLDAVSDAEAAAAIQRIEVNGLKIGVVDIASASAPDAPHLIGAMVPFEGATWFFKLTGPHGVVAPQKAALLEMLKTVKPAAATTP
jgi:hypothetical protein